MAKVLRWEVPINGKDVVIKDMMGRHTGIVNLVDLGPFKNPYLEFWTYDPEDLVAKWSSTFRAFATGVEIPEGYRIVGSSNRVNDQVYHLFEKAG
jgi:hypothetical protein